MVIEINLKKFRSGTHNGPSKCIHGKPTRQDKCLDCIALRNCDHWRPGEVSVPATAKMRCNGCDGTCKWDQVVGVYK